MSTPSVDKPPFGKPLFGKIALIGQSRDRQGTLFEMMLPRAAGD